MKKSLTFFVWLLLVKVSLSQQGKTVIRTPLFSIRMNEGNSLWTYSAARTGKSFAFRPPVFDIDGRHQEAGIRSLAPGPVTHLTNGTREQVFKGTLSADKTIQCAVSFRWAEDNPIIRFRYTLTSNAAHHFSKPVGKDELRYFSLSMAPQTRFKEIRLSDFNEKVHATCLEEVPVEQKDFEDSASLMGPMFEAGDDRSTFILAYEHGSQFPDRFLEFCLGPDKSVTLQAVKGNYLDGHLWIRHMITRPSGLRWEE